MPTSGIDENEPSERLYNFLAYELQFERARKQEIFSWASSLLIAIIGGMIALTAYHTVILDLAYKRILTGAVVILGGIPASGSVSIGGNIAKSAANFFSITSKSPRNALGPSTIPQSSLSWPCQQPR
jgi:hypothetical protein